MWATEEKDRCVTERGSLRRARGVSVCPSGRAWDGTRSPSWWRYKPRSQGTVLPTQGGCQAVKPLNCRAGQSGEGGAVQRLEGRRLGLRAVSRQRKAPENAHLQGVWTGIKRTIREESCKPRSPLVCPSQGARLSRRTRRERPGWAGGGQGRLGRTVYERVF